MTEAVAWAPERQSRLLQCGEQSPHRRAALVGDQLSTEPRAAETAKKQTLGCTEESARIACALSPGAGALPTAESAQLRILFPPSPGAPIPAFSHPRKQTFLSHRYTRYILHFPSVQFIVFPSPSRLISQPHLCILKGLIKAFSQTKEQSSPKDEFCCHP